MSPQRGTGSSPATRGASAGRGRGRGGLGQ